MTVAIVIVIIVIRHFIVITNNWYDYNAYQLTINHGQLPTTWSINHGELIMVNCWILLLEIWYLFETHW